MMTSSDLQAIYLQSAKGTKGKVLPQTRSQPLPPNLETCASLEETHRQCDKHSPTSAITKFIQTRQESYLQKQRDWKETTGEICLKAKFLFQDIVMAGAGPWGTPKSSINTSVAVALFVGFRPLNIEM